MRERKKEKERKESLLSWGLYALLAILILLYAAYGSVLVGAAAFILIVFIVVYEVKTSIRTEGTRKSLIDIISAIGAAVVVWVALIFVLQTPAPVDAVSSCSMLPVLHRGDLVVLHGIGNVPAFLASRHVPVVNLTSEQFARMESNIESEFVAFFAYSGSTSNISFTIPKNLTQYSVGLYNTSCVSEKNYLGEQSQVGRCMVRDQSANLIRYNYSIGSASTPAGPVNVVYTSQISIGNTTLSENYSNPITVYQTTSKDTFSGSVVHRLFAVLNVSGQYYFLTKGDNNQALDLQFGNYPASSKEVLGYVITDVPAIGYVKLLLSGQLATPAGCNETLQR